MIRYRMAGRGATALVCGALAIAPAWAADMVVKAPTGTAASRLSWLLFWRQYWCGYRPEPILRHFWSRFRTSHSMPIRRPPAGSAAFS